jgi:glycosyltransferase involved in cell wall biosynthesis
MKILYSALTEHFWMHITEVVNNMADLGHEVHVAGFLRSRPKTLHPSVAFYNITLRNRGWREFCDPVFWQELLRWGRKRLSPTPMPSFYECWLEDIMEMVRFDLVYERNCFLNPAIALASKRGIPSILEFNGIWPLEAEWKGYPVDQVRCFLKKEVSAAKQATRVICVGQGALDYYMAQGVDVGKLHVIPNGANPDLFQPMDKQQCRGRVGIGFKEKIIGFSGSLQIFYELDCVIRAMPLILKRVPEARLVVVGRDYPPPFGLGRSVLRSLAKQLGVAERVDFLDIVLYEEVPYYINSSDVCLLPLVKRDDWQAALSPLKLREYLACGRPVIASNVIGDTQIVKGIEAGLLYKPGDPRDLAEKVCVIFENPGLAQEMADNGRRYVLAHDTWRHVTERIMAIAKEIVTSPTM